MEDNIEIYDLLEEFVESLRELLKEKDPDSVRPEIISAEVDETIRDIFAGELD